MPNTASAKKRHRQNQAARLRNRTQRSDLRTSIRRVNEALEAYASARADGSDTDTALEAVNNAYVSAQKKIDKAGSKSLIHRNKAARIKKAKA